jgi:stearoyl-CoA desaturase (delta-9 desaturase)
MSSPVAVASVSVGLPLLGSAAAITDAARHGVTAPDAVLLCAMYVACAFGTELGFHRLLSHRSFKATTPVLVALGVLGSMAAQGPPLFWAAVHRQHHARADRRGDPHSPYARHGWHHASLRGLVHAHLGWLFIPEEATFEPHINDLLKDRRILRLNRLYPLWVVLGIALPAAVGLCHSGSLEGAIRGALWGGFFRITAWQQVTWSVNSIGHVFGARPFATGDRSTNNVWLALFTLGGSWHNNHHAFPSSAKVGLRVWELDLHYVMVRALAALRLVSDVRVPIAGKVAAARLRGERVQDEIVSV